MSWTKAALRLALLGALMGLPLWFTLGDDGAARKLLSDRGFLAALGVQGLMSALAAVRMHRELAQRSDDERLLAAIARTPGPPATTSATHGGSTSGSGGW